MTAVNTSRAGKALLLAVIFGAAVAAAQPASAQQGQRGGKAELAPSGVPNGYYVPRGSQGVGYPLTFSWIWGPAKMPPAPTDFGPNLDFSASGYTLNGVPNRSPYPD